MSVYSSPVSFHGKECVHIHVSPVHGRPHLGPCVRTHMGGHVYVQVCVLVCVCPGILGTHSRIRKLLSVLRVRSRCNLPPRYSPQSHHLSPESVYPEVGVRLKSSLPGGVSPRTRVTKRLRVYSSGGRSTKGRTLSSGFIHCRVDRFPSRTVPTVVGTVVLSFPVHTPPPHVPDPDWVVVGLTRRGRCVARRVCTCVCAPTYVSPTVRVSVVGCVSPCVRDSVSGRDPPGRVVSLGLGVCVVCVCMGAGASCAYVCVRRDEVCLCPVYVYVSVCSYRPVDVGSYDLSDGVRECVHLCCCLPSLCGTVYDTSVSVLVVWFRKSWSV